MSSLGPNWELARVRGTPYNTGDGAGWRSTSARSRGVLQQPRRAAFQIFDHKMLHLLREEYRIREVTKAEAMTLEELARKLEIDVDGFVRTVREYNAAVQDGTFNPAVKDAKGTQGITPPKSNWALALDTPPYGGYAITTGISFTFGGLRITSSAQVIDREISGSPTTWSCTARRDVSWKASCSFRQRRSEPRDVRATSRLRKLLGGDGILVAPGAFDGLSARLVERAGFRVVYATGGGTSRSTGIPDMGAARHDGGAIPSTASASVRAMTTRSPSRSGRSIARGPTRRRAPT